MRITEGTLYRDMLSQLEHSQTTIAKYTQQLSTGKRLNVPSDDPLGAALDVGAYANLGALARYSSAADAATAGLSVVDSALTDINNQLLAAKTALQSVQGSSVTAAQRDAAVATLKGVREALVSDLDTRVQGVYVFAGAKVQTSPYTISSGVVSAYQGDGSSVSIDVGTSTSVPVTFDGQAIARGSDSSDIFQSIDAMITAIQNGDQSGMQTGAAALDGASQRVAVVQTTVGLSLNRLQSQTAHLTAMKTAQQGQISSLEDADLSAAITGLQQAQTAEQAAMAALGSTGQLKTLMEYIR